MDFLQPLPFDEWPLLRDTFKRDWPIYGQYYYWINSMIKWITKDPEYPTQIYCPDKKHDSGIFVAISSDSLYLVVVGSLERSKDLLQKALWETRIIDWNQYMAFQSVHQCLMDTVINSINKIQERESIKISEQDDAHCYFKSKEECAKLSINVPPDCELRPLDSSHIPLIHSVWPHRNEKHPELSMKFLDSFVKHKRGIGLFLKKDNSLVSWILHTEWDGLGMVQTVEEQKRKGYGKIVVKALAKELAIEENLDSILFIVDGNIPSKKLFESLGYKKIHATSWLHVEPHFNKDR